MWQIGFLSQQSLDTCLKSVCDLILLYIYSRHSANFHVKSELHCHMYTHYVYVYTHTHIHTYLCVYVCVCISMYTGLAKLYFVWPNALSLNISIYQFHTKIFIDIISSPFLLLLLLPVFDVTVKKSLPNSMSQSF